MKMTKIALNLGCGNKHIQSDNEYRWYNVDNWEGCKPQILLDLNAKEYPWKDNSVDLILLNGSLEHLDNWENCLKECWRICKKETGRIIIEVPNFNYAWYHTYHKVSFTFQTIELFNRYNSQEYFDVMKVKQRWTRSELKVLRFFGFFIDFFANLGGSKGMFIADRVWGYWVGGFEALILDIRPLNRQPYKGSYEIKKVRWEYG